MSLTHGFGERIGNPSPDPYQGRFFDAELHGDGVSRLETDATDATRRAVRVSVMTWMASG
jgi:hypothetical protein